jgi:glycerol-3-phosphate acyltransferase PlsY
MEFRMVPVIVVSYLLGAIPFGYIIGRLKNIDITKTGSGNIGATNAFRILGPFPGAAVLVLDAAKAALAAYIGQTWGGTSTAALIAGGTAILGHSYSPFLNFKGGRGVACAAGVLLFLMPRVVLIEVVIWVTIIAITRYVSWGSITIAVLLPFVIWLDGKPTSYIIFGLLIGVFVVYKHRPNIQRLLAGTENRFGKKP